MTVDYSKLKVAEIKQMLIDEERYTLEQLDTMEVKGKSGWVELHRGEVVPAYEWDMKDELDNLLDDVNPMTVEAEPVDPDTPRYFDAGWNDYVMAQFDPDELIDGKYPNVNSLRRMVELLLGEIVFSGPVNVEQTMDAEHTGKAVVTYKVTIDWQLGGVYAGNLDVPVGYGHRSFLSVASSWVGNTDDIFAVFPESIAETRAEGRALRRALRINVVCADELTKKDTAAVVQQQKESVSTTGDWEENSLITDQQTNTIKMMCDRLQINLTKFINSGSKQYKSIDNVNRVAAAGMLKQLNRYQSSGSDSIDIPQNLIGD